MKKSDVLKKQLKALASAKDLQDVLKKFKALKDGESITDDEQAIIDKYNDDCETLHKQINTTEDIEKAMANAQPDDDPAPGSAGPSHFQKMVDMRAANEKKGTLEERAIKEYSFVKALKEKINGKPFEGLEKDIQQEAMKEAKESGVKGGIQGIGMPAFFLNPNRKIAQVGGGDPTLGANTINTTLTGPIGPLAPNIEAINMGCQTMLGLKGNYEIIKDGAVWEARWEGEFSENKEEDLNDTKIPMTPTRLGAKTRFSTTILVQSSLDVEARARRKLQFAIGNKIDKTIINGSGVGNEMKGILNLDNTNVISLGDDGGPPTWPALVRAMKSIKQVNADRGSYGILTSPLAMGTLMTTKVDAGSGVFIADKMGNTRIVESTNIPTDLNKGLTLNGLHALIAGYWSSCVLGNWSGVDVVIDQITRADFGEIKVTANTFWDIVFEYEEAFSVIKDFSITGLAA